MSDNKSGFEIRADLLSQAQGILQDNYQRQVDAVYLHNDSFPNDKKPLPTSTISACLYLSLSIKLVSINLLSKKKESGVEFNMPIIFIVLFWNWTIIM